MCTFVMIRRNLNRFGVYILKAIQSIIVCKANSNSNKNLFRSIVHEDRRNNNNLQCVSHKLRFQFSHETKMELLSIDLNFTSRNKRGSHGF